MPKGIKGFQKGHQTFISKEAYKAIAQKNKGKKRTEDTKAKMRESNKDNVTGLKNGLKTRFNATGVKGHILLGKNGYRQIHQWIEKEKGKPTKCSKCDKDGLTGRQIHWANISGEYKKDINDWIRLCAKCHFNKDGRLITNK